MRQGATDYLIKTAFTRLAPAVQVAVEPPHCARRRAEQN
jgi:hypothetical protein